MLRLYFNELKKLKRQRIIRIICILGLIMPVLWTLICIRDQLPYRSLVGLNILIGNFLITPSLFSVILLLLFQIEEQNDTMKNILVTTIEKWKIYIIKLVTALFLIIIFNIVTCLYTLIGGMFLNDSGYVGRTFAALLLTAIASISASLPILLVIVIFRKRYLVSMIFVNCFIIIQFLLLWQVTMLKLLDLHLPFLIAYRITYPLQIVNYTFILQEGIDRLYYPASTGVIVLAGTAIVSAFSSMLIYIKQKI
ncbi:MAG: ABC transporter permease [Anaerocolumna aminovalerica]|uniref:ABC transporter permease n=1 Tax=Anaerocolumna aminovalerica TaxID=1527 RepID=UPI001C0ECFDB|nr:ABC transporter permease [Anaerocolumna aminovalerica]MBU5334608.1 ABC transporter permease [Anaerocolumna aminovalerica]MDU6264771.1 ABC transporter permease [Anaerocolumna aminovalerica]